MNTKALSIKLCSRKALLLFIALIINLVFLRAQSPDIDSLKTWMNFLASDDMKGRKNGSPENEKVANWIAQKYSNYGIQPLPGQQSFIQSFKQRIRKDSVVLKNIVGFIPGADTSRFIVLTAHYDHIGMSTHNTQDSVFNGADDDASGIVTLIAIAKKFRELNLKPSCSIIFASFSGEEIGLKGSAYFCKSNLIPMQKVKLNLNFELTGRSDEIGKNRYYITGPKRSNLEQILKVYNQEKQWQLADIGFKANMLYFMADNFSFGQFINNTKMKIPAHTFATSVGEGYVHKEHDEVQYMDFENLNALIDYVSPLILTLCESNTEIVSVDNAKL